MLRDTVEAVGTTRALRAVDIVPLSSGRLTALTVTPGMEIAEGAVIAQLNSAIEAAALAEAEARLREAELAMERAQALRQSNTVSQATLLQAEVALATAQAGVDQARQRLSDRTVVAPFTGVLGLARVDAGARVTEQTILTTLDDISAVEVEFQLSETLIGRVAIGQNVEASAAAFPGRVFAGTVISIDSRIDPASRAFLLRARLPNLDRTLPAGMFMRLSVVISEREALAVADEAVVLQAGEAIVYRVEEDVAHRIVITPGERHDGLVEILGGLDEGDEIVLRGTQSLRDGATIRRAGEGQARPAGAGAQPAASSQGS